MAKEEQSHKSVIHKHTLEASEQAAWETGVTMTRIAGPWGRHVFNKDTQPKGVILSKNQAVLQLDGTGEEIGRFSVRRLELLRKQKSQS